MPVILTGLVCGYSYQGQLMQLWHTSATYSISSACAHDINSFLRLNLKTFLRSLCTCMLWHVNYTYTAFALGFWKMRWKTQACCKNAYLAEKCVLPPKPKNSGRFFSHEISVFVHSCVNQLRMLFFWTTTSPVANYLLERSPPSDDKNKVIWGGGNH